MDSLERNDAGRGFAPRARGTRWHARLLGFTHAVPGRRFRLTRYFTLTSLVAFAAFAVALYHLERAEETFLEQVQGEQGRFYARAQAELVGAQRKAALANLLTAHEAGHITLATVLANALWDSHFVPLVAAAQRLPIDHCRLLGGPADQGRRECFAVVGKQIRSTPGFAGVDAAVHAMMRNSLVFKIKVYDPRGITVYSSELAQIGEDKATNKGWLSAIEGKRASELVHRDRFSAFEGVVENRDLIQSYLPVPSRDGKAIAAVFEIYSDVTPLLRQIEDFSAQMGRLVAENEARVEASRQENLRKVYANSNEHLAILGGLMVLLYLALLVLVRYGQRIIDEQARARAQALQREQLWHREKMAALATMAANASHEIGNPLAVISSVAGEIAAAPPAGGPLAGQGRTILDQAARIAEMTRRITEFATTQGDKPELLDVNRMAKAVGDFLGFDSRYRGTRIEMRLADRLPACTAIPDHLNEVLMSLMQAHAEISSGCAGSGGRVIVRTEERGGEVAISIGCECGPPGNARALPGTDSRLEAARLRVEGMGGRLAPTPVATEILLPC